MKQANVSLAYMGTKCTSGRLAAIKGVFVNDFARNKSLYLLMLPVFIFYIVFNYAPMYGAVIAFKEYSPMKGILRSPWIGLTNFYDFFNGVYFFRVLKNTIFLSVSNLVFGFPAPIILSLLLNELKNEKFKKIVQTVTYLPYFISLVVVCGLITNFTNSDGILNILCQRLGYDGFAMLQKSELFMPIYVISGIWQRIGWDSIIYIAALTGIASEQYEAARIDGAGRWKQLWHVTLPGMLPTIIVMLILRIGGLMNVGYEKIILLYNPITYETADVISSYVYRKGIQELNWSYSTAVGLFNSVINFALLIAANKISKKVSENSLW